MQSNVFSTNKTLNLGGRIMDLSVPKVMGILNVTPDSFYDGSKYSSIDSALAHVEKMLSEGADFIDVGGHSTRPGAAEITEAEESQRTIPVVAAITKRFPDTIISIDTFRSGIAKAAINEGALIVNDISGGEADPKMWTLVAEHKMPYVMMHMRGNPQNMTSLTDYEHLIKNIIDYFHPRLEEMRKLRVSDVIVDPGFGFAKTIGQNFELLKQLELLKILGKPILVGISRKSMIWRTLETDPEHALNGTTALNSAALLKGADILRVHDVREAVEAVKLINFVR